MGPTRLLIAASIALMALLPWVAMAENGKAEPRSGHAQAERSSHFEIKRSVIAAGGLVNAAAAQWNLAGTIGQFDATAPAALSGGDWAVSGGFWTAVLEPPPTMDQLFSDRFELPPPQP